MERVRCPLETHGVELSQVASAVSVTVTIACDVTRCTKLRNSSSWKNLSENSTRLFWKKQLWNVDGEVQRRENWRASQEKWGKLELPEKN